MSPNQLKKARGIAYRLLAHKARTIKQMRDALLRKNITAETTEQIINELIEEGYLNDRKYVHDYIAFRINGDKPYGPYWLRASLQKSGAERNLVDEEIAAVFSSGREEELAMKLLDYLTKTREMSREKAMRRLLSRGFSADVARSIIVQRGLSSSFIGHPGK